MIARLPFTPENVRGLTLWRPWDWCFTHDVSGIDRKDIENRGHRPPMALIGGYLALHAGLKYDYDRAPMIKRVLGVADIPTTQHSQIVAVTRLVGWVHVVASKGPKQGGLSVLGASEMNLDTLLEALQSPWLMGEFGWVVQDTLALRKPVGCRGAQGVWMLPPNVFDAVREQVGSHFEAAA